MEGLRIRRCMEWRGIREQSQSRVHTHDYVEIFYFAGGRADIVTTDQTYHVALYDMIVYPVGTPHSVRWQTDQVRHTYSLGLVAPGFTPGHTLHLRDTDGTLKWLVEQIHREYNAKVRDEALALCYAQALLRLIARRTGDAPASADPVERVQQFIEENYMQALTLKTLAALLPVSESYLSRVFRRQTGMTCMQYLQQVRVEAARRLLQQTDLSVEAVAGAVGYVSSKHFARVFREAVGQSPRAFRQA